MRQYLLGIVACFLSTALLAADPPAPTFRAGAATSNITPALGSAIIGGFLPFPATNVHDELHARCLVLDDGKTKLALVVVDLLGIHYNVSHEARKFIEQEAGIPATNVLISAIHNHSAASALGEKHFEFPQKIDDYQAFVARRIADPDAGASAADRRRVHRQLAQRDLLRDRPRIPRAEPCAASLSGLPGARLFRLPADAEAARVGRLRDLVGYQPLGAECLGKAARHAAGNGG